MEKFESLRHSNKDVAEQERQCRMQLFDLIDERTRDADPEERRKAFEDYHEICKDDVLVGQMINQELEAAEQVALHAHQHASH